MRHRPNHCAVSSPCPSCTARNNRRISSPTVSRNARSPSHRSRCCAWQADSDRNAPPPPPHAWKRPENSIFERFCHWIRHGFRHQPFPFMKKGEIPGKCQCFVNALHKNNALHERKNPFIAGKQRLFKSLSSLHGGCRGFESLIAHLLFPQK